MSVCVCVCPQRSSVDILEFVLPLQMLTLPPQGHCALWDLEEGEWDPGKPKS